MKTVLVAGSSSGIGRSVTESVLARGDAVVGLARDHSKFTPDSDRYEALEIDFSKITELEVALKLLPVQRDVIDALVCCVGYGHFAELEQFSAKQMQTIMDVNFLSQAILIKQFIPIFKKRGSGAVIILGSECALQGSKKAAMYCASKFALRGFAQSLRDECANSGVAVTMINPGLVETPFFDSLDFKPADADVNKIQPAQIADAVSMILAMTSNCVVEEINLQPMKSAVQRV